jgi:hypothetical protein
MTERTLNPLWQAAVQAALIANVVNASIYLVGRATGAIVGGIPVMGDATLGFPNVIGFSVLPPLVAALLLQLLIRRTKRPWPIFVAIAAVVFVAMIPGPFMLAGAPASMVWLLQFMHVVVAAPVLLLYRRALPNG